MTQQITLTAKAKKIETKGRKGEVISSLRKLGADKKAVSLDAVKKDLKKIDASQLRMHIRTLRDEKILTVKKQAKEKAAAA